MYFFFLISAGMEATFDLPMDSPEWRPDSPATLETLRPPTPTGSLGYGDPDLLVGGKPTPPAAEAAERPRTPGRGIAGEDSADEFLSLPLTGRLVANPLLSPSPELHASYPTDQDQPKTPGREEGRGWGLPHASARVPATPGGAASPSKEATAAMFTPPLSLCSHPYVRTPRTPGRDIVLRHGPPARRRRRRSGAMGGRGGPPSEGSPLLHLRHRRSLLPLSSACWGLDYIFKMYPKRLTISQFVRRKRNNNVYRCRCSKDVHRTITRLTHSPYTTETTRKRGYTILSPMFNCRRT